MDAVSRLRNVYFLEHLTPEELEALAEMMDLRPYLPGDNILTQGEPTTNFYIVDSGYVNMRVTDQHGFERPVGSKGPGDFFGVKMFTTQEESEYTFEAVGKAELWVVERQDWDALLEQFPSLLDHMPELRAEYLNLTRGLDWLAPGEVIYLLTRRHWWALFLMMRLPLFVAALFTIAVSVSDALGVVQNLTWIVLVYGLVLAVCLLWGLYEAADWWNDTYIVTNKRVVRLNKVLFFSDARDEIPIEKIQSQTISRGGPISVLLNISDLRITSAASNTAGVLFDQVGDVQRIQKEISKQQARIIERRSAAERERLRSQIAGEIRHYVFQQPPAREPPPAVSPPPVSLRARLAQLWKRSPRAQPPPGSGWGGFWNSLYGTEMREGKTVTWRKHHFILLSQIFPGLAAWLILFLLTLFVAFGGVPFNLSLNGVYAVLLALMIPALVYIAWQWADWRVDLYRLSEKDIVDVESLPFRLNYHEQKAELSKIQDITTTRPRFINTLLDFGNVEVRVAGSAEPFTFQSVARPDRVADEISERMEIVKIRAADRSAREQTRQIVDAIVAYHRLAVAERLHATPPTEPTNPVAAVAQTDSSSAAPPPPPPHPTPADGEFPPED